MFVYILIYFIPYLATVDNFVTSLAFLRVYIIYVMLHFLLIYFNDFFFNSYLIG